MKKRLIPLILLLALLTAAVLWTTATETMAFVAVNDTIPMTLSGDAAPYYIDDTLYVPYMAFDANPNGVVVSYNQDKNTFVLFTRSRRLVFDLAEGTVTDENEKVTEVEVAYRSGLLFLPASAASHFGVTVSLLTSQSGYPILRFTNGSQVYDDELFVEKAENLIDYMVRQEGGQEQEWGGSGTEPGESLPPDVQTEERPVIVYLAFAGDAVCRETLDALEKNQLHAAFFLTARQLTAEKELVRSIYAAGHTVGITVEDGAEQLTNSLADANEAMEAALFHKTLFALVPAGSSGGQDGYCFLEEPALALTAATALTIPEIPQLLVCRTDGPGAIQTLTAANASMPQLLETTFGT